MAMCATSHLSAVRIMVFIGEDFSIIRKSFFFFLIPAQACGKLLTSSMARCSVSRVGLGSRFILLHISFY